MWQTQPNKLNYIIMLKKKDRWFWSIVTVQIQSHYCSASFCVPCFYQDSNLDDNFFFLWTCIQALHVCTVCLIKTYMCFCDAQNVMLLNILRPQCGHIPVLKGSGITELLYMPPNPILNYGKGVKQVSKKPPSIHWTLFPLLTPSTWYALLHWYI